AYIELPVSALDAQNLAGSLRAPDELAQVFMRRIVGVESLRFALVQHGHDPRDRSSPILCHGHVPLSCRWKSPGNRARLQWAGYLPRCATMTQNAHGRTRSPAMALTEVLTWQSVVRS